MVKVTPPAQFVVKAIAQNKFFVFPQAGLRGFSAYQLAVQNGFEGTVLEWLASLAGEAGKSIEMDIRQDSLFFRQEGGSWQLFVTKQEIAGEDGKSVELQKTATHIQWRQEGGSWGNLVALADLKGDAGPNEVTSTTNTNLNGLLIGTGPNSKVSAATPAQAQQLVIPSLTNHQRRNLTGLIPPYRVYDLDWKADFLWDGAQWEQLTTPLVSDSQMLMLPNPEVGYKVFNTTWNSEHVWIGFWQGQRRVIKPSATSYAGTNFVTEPHLRIAITPGLWVIQIKCNITSSPGGWRYNVLGPAWSEFASPFHIGGSSSFLLTRNSATGTINAASTGVNNLVQIQEFRWRSSNDGTIFFNVAQNTNNGSAFILEDSEISAIKIA